MSYGNDIIFQDLLRHLVNSNRVSVVSEKFSALKNNSDKVTFVYDLLKKYKLLPVNLPDEKNNAEALKLRQQGNNMFKMKKNEEALDLYTKSLIQSDENSENSSLALANRCAVLFDYGLYEECLMDIDRALESNYPENLKWKLHARRENAQKLKCQKSQLYFEPVPKISEELQNKDIECATEALEIKYTEELGRHIVAKRDIQVGEILAVEKPFCHILSKQLFNHCHECLTLCYNLIPCHNCTQALYCNEECKHKAIKYHKFECKILKTLRHLQLDKMKMLPLKIALIVRDLYHSIDEECKLTPGEQYLSSRYKEIHNLVSNADRRLVSDLFQRSASAAVIYHLVKTHASFFQTEQDETIFKVILLHHLQTAPSNFHEISELAENGEKIYELEEIGAGSYSFLSLFNHSCSPNVVRHCHGNSIVLRAIQSIRSGEQCCDNYGYHYALMEKHDRRSNLKNQYFFDCHCEVCMNDWPLFPELVTIATDITIDASDFTGLQRGDIECAKKVLQYLLPRMVKLECLKPNKNHAEMQEVLKQCFALFGNTRRII